MGFNTKENQWGPTVRIGSNTGLCLETEIIQGVRGSERAQKSGEDFITFIFKTYSLDYILLKNNFQKEIKSQLIYKMNTY